MARKSRKNPVVLEKSRSDFYNAAGYIRLSVSNKDSSSSIENQKMLIEDWIKQSSDVILHKFYIDTNVTGRIFRRPAFEEMLDDISKGEINCVIVKDLSRLGRDLISTGFYIEKFFPSNNVRFVSINDRFDTLDGITNISFERGSTVRIPIINAFNESIALDIKHKTEAALRAKMESGMFVGPRAPFGYVKSADDRFKLVPDPDAAIIVQKMFELASSGVAVSAIVRYLNEHHVLTPIEYARSKGLTGNYDDGDGIWNSRSVKYMLKNRVYTGVLEQGNGEHVVAGTHEALVNEIVFNDIQKRFTEQSFYLVPKDQVPENILKGKVKCGDCESKMQRRRGTGHADWFFFTCNTNNRVGAERCSGAYIREEDIFKAVYYQLGQYLKAHIMSSTNYQQRKHTLEDEVALCEKALDEVNRIMLRNYERMVLHEITQEEYNERRAIRVKPSEDLEAAKLKIIVLEKAFQTQTLLMKVKDKELPLSEAMNFISKIVVHKERKVAVSFNP